MRAKKSELVLDVRTFLVSFFLMFRTEPVDAHESNQSGFK